MLSVQPPRANVFRRRARDLVKRQALIAGTASILTRPIAPHPMRPLSFAKSLAELRYPAGPGARVGTMGGCGLLDAGMRILIAPIGLTSSAKTYQRNTNRPTTAPATADSAMPSEYQMATKAAVYSGQCRP